VNGIVRAEGIDNVVHALTCLLSIEMKDCILLFVPKEEIPTTLMDLFIK